MGLGIGDWVCDACHTKQIVAANIVEATEGREIQLGERERAEIIEKRGHMKRREFLNAAALTAGGTMIAGSHELLEAQGTAGQAPAGAQGATPPTPKHTFKTRPAKVEILFKAPGLSGNGMQVTDEGIWTIDIAGSRGDTPGRCKVYLSSFDGKLVRELAPEGTGPSGIGPRRQEHLDWIDLQPRNHSRRCEDRRDDGEALHAWRGRHL